MKHATQIQVHRILTILLVNKNKKYRLREAQIKTITMKWKIMGAAISATNISLLMILNVNNEKIADTLHSGENSQNTGQNQ